MPKKKDINTFLLVKIYIIRYTNDKHTNYAVWYTNNKDII